MHHPGPRVRRVPIRKMTLYALFFALLAVSLAACGGSRQEVTVPTQVPTLEPAQATATPEPAPTATPEPEPTNAPAEEEAPAEGEGESQPGESAEVAESEQIAPRVFFLQPTDNAIVPITSTVVMGFEGVEVQPSGEVVEGAGHMHIMVDTDFVPAGETVPKDETHLHFGDGSLEADLSLAPGAHTLGLQFADGAHMALEGDQFQHVIIVSAQDGAPEQSVRFATPTDGATVPPSFDIVMAATGLIVEPAGETRPNAGHLHVMIDSDYIPAGEVIPKDDTHLHFGAAQLTGTVELEPGAHTLRLQFADGAHTALEGDQYRAEINVTVAEDAPANQVMFVMPEDGAIIEPVSDVKWAAAGLIIEPSGPVIRENGGHLHLLVNEDFVPAGEAIPKDDTHLHFGGAQTSTELTLEPGAYTLRLQMANGAHIAMDGDQYRDEISVTVE